MKGEGRRHGPPLPASESTACEGDAMVCHHLKDLYQLCQDHQLRLGSSDLIRVVCLQCGQQEVCPSTLMDEYDSRRGEEPPPLADESKEGIARDARGSSGTA